MLILKVKTGLNSGVQTYLGQATKNTALSVCGLPWDIKTTLSKWFLNGLIYKGDIIFKNQILCPRILHNL